MAIRKKSKSVVAAEALVEREKKETLDAEIALKKELDDAKRDYDRMMEVKIPELTERRKFANWYNAEYLKGTDMNELHHSDKHGQLGYESNSFMNEIHTVTGKIELVKCYGLCPKCTITLPSAKEEYENR